MQHPIDTRPRGPRRTTGLFAFGLLSITLIIFIGGCAAAPVSTSSSMSALPDRAVHARMTPDRAMKMLGRMLCVDHPMLIIWRDQALSRLQKSPQSWAIARERTALAKVSGPKNAAESVASESSPSLCEIMASGAVPEPLWNRLETGDVNSSGLGSGTLLAQAAHPIERYAPDPMPRVSAVIGDSSSRLHARADRIDLGMRIGGVVFLLVLLLTPAMCDLWASFLVHPQAIAPKPAGRARSAPILHAERLSVSI